MGFDRAQSSPTPSTPNPSGDERGFVLVWFALLIFVMLGVAAFAVDLGHAYYVGQQAQDAADAAALSASSYLPDNCINADPHAQNIAGLNGFPNGGVNQVTAVNGAPGTGCDNDSSLKPNEIRVNIKSTIDTWFARAIGIDTVTVNKSSTAEYDPPVQLGSPHSYFGEAPGCDTCTEQPNIWASTAGQDNRKVDGNAIFEGWCANSSADNCSGSGIGNIDRDPNGMLFEISNPKAESLKLEVFDPGFVDAGQPTAANPKCNDPMGSVYPYCDGDETLSHMTAGAPAVTTKYTIYPLDNLDNPLGNPPICTVTYPGYFSYAAALAASASNPNDLTFRSYHAWANIATDGNCLAPLTGTSYVLQVQSGDDISGPPQAGVNMFSVAACSTCSSSQPEDDPNVDVSAITKMSLFTDTPIGTANPQFYLARVPSWAKGQTLTLSFFDVGDISGPSGPIGGALTVSAVDATHGPAGAPVGEFSGCRYSHPGSPDRGYIQNQTTPWGVDANGNPPSDTEWTDDGSLQSMGGCTAPVNLNGSGNAAAWNGKWVTWDIPIPTDYTCDDRDATKCWLQIQYKYTNAQFHDATTWTATLSGNPVRLTK